MPNDKDPELIGIGVSFAADSEPFANLHLRARLVSPERMLPKSTRPKTKRWPCTA